MFYALDFPLARFVCLPSATNFFFLEGGGFVFTLASSPSSSSSSSSSAPLLGSNVYSSSSWSPSPSLSSAWLVVTDEPFNKTFFALGNFAPGSCFSFL
jgi:hypothetical protein